MTRRVLITGAAGQVGAELARAQWPDDVVLIALDRAGLDITDATAVSAVVASVAPHTIVNAAAYTAVDRAEAEADRATAVNHSGVRNLVEAATAVDARLIQLSTDYVFDGTKDGWYVESDAVAPLGVYGRSKAAGEAAAATMQRHLILRTAWVYGALGPNFVATMLRLAAERDELAVVADQVGCPTSAADIATAIVDIVTSPEPDELCGLYHLASPQPASWFEFAAAILAEPIAAGSVALEPITTDEYPTKARRPANSRLDSSAIAADGGIVLPRWSTTLPSVLAELGRADRGATP